jgi:DNA-binding beta-propeller fold protein YncE
MRGIRAALCGMALSTSAMAAGDAAAPAWQELHRYTLGGASGWDLLAVDADSRRVFLTRGEHLMVVNVDTGNVEGDIVGLKRAHGVALVPALQRGYVSSGGDDRVLAFDLKTLAVVATIPLKGKNPDAMVYDTHSKRVFAFNGRSNDADVIDPAKNAVVASVSLPGKPELAVSDGHGKVFVNLEDKNQVAEINAASGKVTHTWPLGACEDPSGLAIDAAHRRLFSVCANHKMVVLDAGNGHVVATLPIGDGPDGAAFDATTGIAFSSNSDGTLTLVHEDDANHFRVLATVATPPRSRTIALDAKMHQVILPIAEFGAVPAPSKDEPHPRAPMKPDSFGIVVIGQR